MGRIMVIWANLTKMRSDLVGFAQRALRDQTPEALLAYSVDIDIPRHLLRLRAHFAAPPSENDLDDLDSIEGEIFADYVDDTFIETEIEIVAPGREMQPLPGGLAYVKQASAPP